MKRRWRILIAVGLSVALIDQYTKFLAVKHLTPGITTAHLEAKGLSAAPTDQQRDAVAQLGLLDELGYFYGSVKSPCDGKAYRCPTVGVIGGFWNWRYVENKGAAWGLLANQSEQVRVPFFLIISFVAVVFIISLMRKLEEGQMLMVIALSLVAGGAIGNLTDRLHLTYVIDFIDWYVGTTHWPTFNFADSGITSGVGLIVLQWLKDGAAERKSKKKAQQAAA